MALLLRSFGSLSSCGMMTRLLESSSRPGVEIDLNFEQSLDNEVNVREERRRWSRMTVIVTRRCFLTSRGRKVGKSNK